MRVILALLLLGGWASAQISYTDLTDKLKQGEEPQKIQQEIKTQGIDFHVDLNRLKMMKKDGFPDWLIDALVYAQHRQDIEPAPRRYADEDDYYPYDYYPYRRMNAHLFWDWALGYPFWHSGIWSPYYYSYMSPYSLSSWYWPYWGGYGYYGGYGYNRWDYGRVLPGNRLRRDGYHNRVEDRSVGRARVKGSSKSSSPKGSRSSATRSSSGRSTATRSSGSRSSSGGGKVSSRGYSKGKN